MVTQWCCGLQMATQWSSGSAQVLQSYTQWYPGGPAGWDSTVWPYKCQLCALTPEMPVWLLAVPVTTAEVPHALSHRICHGPACLSQDMSWADPSLTGHVMGWPVSHRTWAASSLIGLTIRSAWFSLRWCCLPWQRGRTPQLLSTISGDASFHSS